VAAGPRGSGFGPSQIGLANNGDVALQYRGKLKWLAPNGRLGTPVKITHVAELAVVQDRAVVVQNNQQTLLISTSGIAQQLPLPGKLLGSPATGATMPYVTYGGGRVFAFGKLPDTNHLVGIDELTDDRWRQLGTTSFVENASESGFPSLFVNTEGQAAVYLAVCTNLNSQGATENMPCQLSASFYH
jgi:hypothetical protein